MISAYISIVYFSLKMFNLFINMDPAYMDLVKIFAGSMGWIGSLTMYMWIREKRKEARRLLARQMARY
jgi:hypothetical protein